MEDLFIKIAKVITLSKEEDPATPIFIGWDDVAGTLTRKEAEDEFGAEGVALAPRILSRGLKKIKTELHDSHVTILCLNQFRTKIATGFGFSTNITTGGRAVKYYAAVRTKITKTSSRVGYITCIAKNEKNKTSPPFQDMKLKIHFEKGLVL
jgi:RecA/RadA recombinase